jgi:hypothetical protein
MSIIHDALKKVQQELTPKTDEAQANSSTATQNTSPYVDEKPAEVEILQKPSMQIKIKSVFILCCALMITLASAIYVYQQLQTNIPKVQSFAKDSFEKIIHRQMPFSFKKKTPDLKSLAQITVNPPSSSKIFKPRPITLNIHGIMSNATGNLVLIDDQVYQEGDVVDGAKIIKINLDSITVDINGTEKTIPVNNT